MPSYNFKRKVKFYVVVDGLQYQIEINPDVSFSQTFNEESRRVKTLHNQRNMFDKVRISRANPANFDFTMPLHREPWTKPVLQLLLDYAPNTPEVTLRTADIYVDTGEEVFKITKAVFERGTFNISNTQVVSVSISGTASKLERIGSSPMDTPGSIQMSSATVKYPDYLEARRLQVRVDNMIQRSINSVSVEIANEVEWLPNNNLHKSLAIKGPSDTVYPEGFVVRGRVLSGNVQQYVTDETLDHLNEWDIDVPLSIQVATSGVYQLSFMMPEAVYTNRLETGDLFIQSYDFRMTSNPTDLSTVIIYEGELS